MLTCIRRSRIENERRTVEAMVAIYCRAHHRHHGLCDDCADLVVYSRKRLACCTFQENKPTCGKCPIHCYKADMRARIKEVMRYAGPRMLWRHPILALLHIRDSRRKIPTHPRRQADRET